MRPTDLSDLLRDDILEWLGGDEPLASELAGMVIPELDGHLERVAGAVEAGDAEAVRQAAHRLKSAIGVFGEHRAWALAGVLENAAREGRLDEAPRLAGELEGAVRTFESVLRTFLD